ncbi:hypothetical protein B0H34DRAFT_708927 [Crassisporium funariophilum]|nr:hypothetical protein B0H34DRAFT_708927 [Crassisporium funariophilum]
MKEHIQAFETKAVSLLPTWTNNGLDKEEKTRETVTLQESTALRSQPGHSTFSELHFTYRRTYIALYVAFLLACNVVIPCLLFYLLEEFTKMGPKTLIGISSAALGLSSCFDSPVRLFRLVKHRRVYGPLGSDVWWHLDFSMWTYTFALLVFAIPLAIAPAIPLFNFFLMSTVMLVGPMGLVFFISLFRPKLPLRCSSDRRGEPMKPAVFYVIEDVASVDFKHGRDFRRAFHDRWNSSPPFQRLMYHLTIYWTVSSIIYCGVTAAISWGTPLRFAFGWVLGQLFVWAGVSALGCRLIAKKGLSDEHDWWSRERSRQMEQVRTSESV